MKHIVYKITNRINGKFYIGRTNDITFYEGYMGSGKLIKLAVKKYGAENFTREILYETTTRKHAAQLERLAINAKDPMCYNMVAGGSGRRYNHEKPAWRQEQAKAKERMERRRQRRRKYRPRPTVLTEEQMKQKKSGYYPQYCGRRTGQQPPTPATPKPTFEWLSSPQPHEPAREPMLPSETRAYYTSKQTAEMLLTQN